MYKSMGIAKQSFFNRSTPKIAHDLIGCVLVHKNGRTIRRLMITETEAYDGSKDKASHASRGKTKRNEIMFRSAGHIYVYFTYGMHWMLNIVTGPEDYPAAVLIRGGIDCDTKMPVNGPARLTKKLGIDGRLNGKRLGRASGLWIEMRTSGMTVCRFLNKVRTFFAENPEQ
jgi:DNA-3-methyladenine glycosylase